MSRRSGLLLLLFVAALAASAGPAWAHVPINVAPDVVETAAPTTQAWQAADAPAGIPWAILAVGLGVALALARRPRRALVLALVLILLLFAFENGVHSVHHMNNRVASASCAVASAAVHVGGTTVDVGPAEPIVLTMTDRLVCEGRSDLQARSLAAHQGRAPPLAA